MESIANRANPDISRVTQADLDQIKSGGVDDADIMYVLKCLLGLLTVMFGLQQLISWLIGPKSSAPDIWTEPSDQTEFHKGLYASNLYAALLMGVGIHQAVEPVLLDGDDATARAALAFITARASSLVPGERNDVVSSSFRGLDADIEFLMRKALLYPNQRVFTRKVNDSMSVLMCKDTFGNAAVADENQPGNFMPPQLINPKGLTQSQKLFVNDILKSIYDEHMASQDRVAFENLGTFKKYWGYTDTAETRFEAWKYHIKTGNNPFDWGNDISLHAFARVFKKRVVIHYSGFANLKQPESYGDSGDVIHILDGGIGNYWLLVPIKSGGSNIFREEMGDLVDLIGARYARRSDKLMKLITDLYPTVASSMRDVGMKPSPGFSAQSRWSLKQVMVFLYIAIALGATDNSRIRDALT